MSKLERVEELLKKFRDGTNLSAEEIVELDSIREQAMYEEVAKIDDHRAAARAHNTVMRMTLESRKIKSPVERMNRAGAAMFKSFKELDAILEGFRK